MTKQDQRVAEGGVALQAAGNATYNAGPNAEQMSQIIVALGSQLATHFAAAEQKIEQRLGKIREKLIEEFSTPGRAKPVAFTDPDFQKVVSEAQETFVRSGDENVADILVQIVANRSQCPARDRLALSLNQAVEVSGSLTTEEFSSLSFLLAFSRTVFPISLSYEEFGGLYRKFVLPFCLQAGRSRGSFDFLVSRQCISLNYVSASAFADVINNGYGSIFTKGCTKAELAARFGGAESIPAAVRSLLTPLEPESDRFKFVTPNATQLKGMLTDLGASPQEINVAVDLFESNLRRNEELLLEIEAFMPEIRVIESYWNDTNIKHCQLTALGIVIGHANIKRVEADFDADLRVWID